MPARDEILAVYEAGPDALVAWVEQVTNAHQRQVAELVAQIEQLVDAHQRELASLTARIEQLEAGRNKDSHNSHKPPSSDGPAKPPRPRSLRQRSGKKSGGQAGHPGVTRVLVDDPDVVVPHVPMICAGCGAALATAPEVHRERRQVIEIPRPRPEVTEHQAAHKVCPVCQTVTAGEFPVEVAQPVQYGPRTKAAAVYLQTYQLLPYERTVEALKDLFGVSLSEGTLTSAQRIAYPRLEPVEQAIQDGLRQADVAHVDESGIRVAGRTEWVHVMSTAVLTFYAHHAKRGRDAFKAIGLLLDFAAPPPRLRNRRASAGAPSRRRPAICSIGWRSIAERSWRSCMTSLCRSITTRPSAICACSRSNTRSPAVSAARKAPPISAAFAATSRRCASKITQSSTGSPAFLLVNPTCRSFRPGQLPPSVRFKRAKRSSFSRTSHCQSFV